MVSQSEKQRYEANTPEWQLEQNMVGCERAASAFHADSERYMRMAEENRAKADRYRGALKKLDPAFDV